MKKGDTLPVKVEGVTVAQAVVEAVETDRVTLLIPGTRAVVGIRVSLTDENTTTPEKETIIDGVTRTEAPDAAATGAAVETIEAPVATATETATPDAAEANAETVAEVATSEAPTEAAVTNAE